MKVWSARAHLVARDDLEHVVGQLLPHRLLLRLDGLDALRHIGWHAGRVVDHGERGALRGRHLRQAAAAVAQEELVGAVVVADDQVERAVAVDVAGRRSLEQRPGGSTRPRPQERRSPPGGLG